MGVGVVSIVALKRVKKLEELFHLGEVSGFLSVSAVSSGIMIAKDAVEDDLKTQERIDLAKNLCAKQFPNARHL